MKSYADQADLHGDQTWSYEETKLGQKWMIEPEDYISSMQSTNHGWRRTAVLSWAGVLLYETWQPHTIACLNLKLWETSHMLSEVMKVVMSSSPRPYKRRAWIGCTYPVYSTDDFNYQLIMKLAIITTSSFQDSFHSRKMSCSRRHVQRRRSISGGKH